MKKDRVFSKVSSADISDISKDELFDAIITIINNLTDDKIIIYVCDKIYYSNDINLLLSVNDTRCIIVNDDVLYNRLKEYNFNLNCAIKFYNE